MPRVGQPLPIAQFRARDRVRDRSDDQLHDALLQRDGDALAQIYDRYASTVFSVALRVIGDREHAQDVAQEVFLALWRAPENYRRERGSLGGWLASAAHHRAVDVVRREEAVLRRVERAGAEAHLAVRESEQSEPVHESAWQSWQSRVVRSAIGELSEVQREALMLAYFGGLTQQEIADHTHVPLGTIKTRTRAGLQKLRDTLDAGAVTDLNTRRAGENP
jgi:RNA polymerase sigma-70 factor (ECF subfamily)